MLDQVIKKALPTGEALYPGYSLLFLFDNAISHSIYAKDALQVAHMNKGPGGQQHFLRPGWYIAPNQKVVIQEMSMVTTDPVTHCMFTEISSEGVGSGLRHVAKRPHDLVRTQSL